MTDYDIIISAGNSRTHFCVRAPCAFAFVFVFECVFECVFVCVRMSVRAVCLFAYHVCVFVFVFVFVFVYVCVRVQGMFKYQHGTKI